MFNHVKSGGCIFSLLPRLVGFLLIGKVASLGAVFRTSILWRWKLRVLPQSVFGQARGQTGWLNQKFDLRFFSFSYQSSKSDFQNYEAFQFFRFWLLCVSQSRVNLGFGKM
ncbi:hypothetical protein PO25_17265 [Vibrio anguillarum]|nr:hypothetical protein [Vibrio anguillarum]